MNEAAPRSELAVAFERVRLALWAIILREYRAAYGDRRLGFLWAFIQPLLAVLVISLIYALIRQRDNPLGGNVMPFIALGFMNLNLFQSNEGYLSGGLNGNKSLLVFPRIKPMDIFVGRLILKSATLMVVYGLLMACFVGLGFVDAPDRPFDLVLPILLLVTLGYGVGVLNAQLTTLYPVYDTVWSVLRRGFFFTSGVFFVADSLPTPVRELLYWQPLLHTCEMIRSAWYSSYDSEFMDPSVPVWFAVASVFVGLAAERVMRKKVLSEL